MQARQIIQVPTARVPQTSSLEKERRVTALPPRCLHVQPVLSFDLGAPVGDLAWAPFSSTVFAAVTDAGRVSLFDLAQSRGAAVCSQRVVRKARLTRLAFNARHPVLLVGDEAGCVHCLKLSPNLRRSFNQGAPTGGGAGRHAVFVDRGPCAGWKLMLRLLQ